jgi:hypothetical protein
MIQIQEYKTKRELQKALPLSYLKQEFAMCKTMQYAYAKCSCGKHFLSINNTQECPACKKAKIIRGG